MANRKRARRGQKVERVVFYRKPPRGRKDKPFSCAICHKSFSKTYYLRLHKMLHTGERPHECDICGKGFRMRWRVVLHRRIHTGEKPYACSACSFRSNRKDNIRGHMVRRHGDVIYAGETTAKRGAAEKLRPRQKRRYLRKIKKEPVEEITQELHQMSIKKESSDQKPDIIPKEEPILPAPLTKRPRGRPRKRPLVPPPNPKLSTIEMKPHKVTQPVHQPKKIQKNTKGRKQSRGKPVDKPRSKSRGRPRGTRRQISPAVILTEKPKESLIQRPTPYKHIKVKMPDRGEDTCGRPMREAARLSYVRRLSMILDEEDIKKEIGDEPAKPREPRRVRPRSDTKPVEQKETKVEVVEEEFVIYEPSEVWITDEDLIFSEGDVLKLEEAINFLDKDGDVLEEIDAIDLH